MGERTHAIEKIANVLRLDGRWYLSKERVLVLDDEWDRNGCLEVTTFEVLEQRE